MNEQPDSPRIICRSPRLAPHANLIRQALTCFLKSKRTRFPC